MHFLQILVPFFIAGFGTCFAGIILDRVQFWPVFVDVDEIFLLLPALLGLKGNLQMTLASRLSTHSHLGHLTTKEDLLGLTCANLSLNQFLSIVISLAASALVTIMHYFISDGPFEIDHHLLITATALLTSSVTSFVLDLLMVMVVISSAQYGINPDNVATPIAASLGDATSLALSSFCASTLHDINRHASFYWVTGIVILLYLMTLPIWAYIIQENVHTGQILTKASHWYPLLSAAIISCISGVILKNALFKYAGIALFQPVICGVGGNLVAVQASRLATLLHRNETPGHLPEGDSICMNPCRMFKSNRPGFDITRLLMAIVIPGQIVFYFFCIYLNFKADEISFKFLLLYLLGSQIQVTILIYLAFVLTYLLWTWETDPDNATIPYLTSISDVLGAGIITTICLVATPREGEKRYALQSV